MTLLSDSQYKDWLAWIPIHMDASASAYQIMSYFLLDKELATQTNLISDGQDQIYDIYEKFRQELLRYAEQSSALNSNLKEDLPKIMNRALVKSIFMPIIYGKKLKSTADDIHSQARNLTYKERAWQ